jgi:hypothetical protein
MTQKITKTPLTARQVYGIPACLRDYKRDTIEENLIYFQNGMWVHNSMLYRLHTKLNLSPREQKALLKDAIEEFEHLLAILKDMQQNADDPTYLFNNYWSALDKSTLPMGDPKKNKNKKLVEEIKKVETPEEHQDRVLRYVLDYTFLHHDREILKKEVKLEDVSLLKQYVFAVVEGATKKAVDFIKVGGKYPQSDIPYTPNPDKKLREGPALLVQIPKVGIVNYIQSSDLKESDLKRLSDGLYHCMCHVQGKN